MTRSNVYKYHPKLAKKGAVIHQRLLSFKPFADPSFFQQVFRAAANNVGMRYVNAIQARKEAEFNTKTLTTKIGIARRNPGRMNGVQWNGHSFICPRTKSLRCPEQANGVSTTVSSMDIAKPMKVQEEDKKSESGWEVASCVESERDQVYEDGDTSNAQMEKQQTSHRHEVFIFRRDGADVEQIISLLWFIREKFETAGELWYTKGRNEHAKLLRKGAPILREYLGGPRHEFEDDLTSNISASCKQHEPVNRSTVSTKRFRKGLSAGFSNSCNRFSIQYQSRTNGKHLLSIQWRQEKLDPHVRKTIHAAFASSPEALRPTAVHIKPRRDDAEGACWRRQQN
ncbi:hypothetical protein L218DRAFT_950503 [Marasmius fiardii PR-910]|nr:hypothetical protein L218DRAFT_950503 [Marasmius fiardii PR-910]